MGLGNVLLLPPMGTSREENITLGNLIGSLRDINDACNLIDESANAALLPASFTGTSYDDGQLLFKLALQHKANYVIHSNIQRFGQRNLAIISRYNTMTRLTDSVYYLDYIDPVEAWIKLPRVVSTIMKLTDTGTEGAFKTYNFWLRYKDGVDRALVDRAVGMLVNDYAEAGRSGTLRNFTVALENMIIARQGDPAQNRVGDVLSGGMRRTLIPDGDWKTYMDKLFDDIRNQRSYNSGSANDAFNDLYFGAEIKRDFSMVAGQVLQRTVDGEVFFIEASRIGSGASARTRLHLFKMANPSVMVTLDFTDMRDFIRQMRGLTLSIANGKPTAGYDLGIIRGEKWNYWKYAGEDSAIPDIITYIKQFPRPPEFRVEVRGTNNARFLIPLSGDILLYYAKENDFSKAVLADIQPIRVDNITYQWRIRNAFNLEPRTQYYFWAVSCWGHLLWLQSEPTAPVAVNTRDGRVTF